MRLLRCDDTSAMTLDVGGVFWQEAVGAEAAAADESTRSRAT